MMDAGLAIRPARVEDIDALVEVFWACFTPAYVSHTEVQEGRAAPDGSPRPEAREKLRAELPLLLAGFPQGVLVAQQQGRIVGFVAGAIVNHGDRDFGLVNDLCVLQEARRHGVGTALLRQACEAFRQAGIVTVFLESNLRNHTAHQLFEQCGFRPISYVFQADLDGKAAG
jgi:ribosomal protein S18 acetylase RimI-like enzyme